MPSLLALLGSVHSVGSGGDSLVALVLTSAASAGVTSGDFATVSPAAVVVGRPLAWAVGVVAVGGGFQAGELDGKFADLLRGLGEFEGCCRLQWLG